MAFTITTTASGFSNGATAIAGVGQETTFTFGGTFVTGDNYTVILTDSATGVQTQIGFGDFTGVVPDYCFVFQNKVYVLAGAGVYFSALALPTTFNDPNGSGNGVTCKCRITLAHRRTSPRLRAIKAGWLSSHEELFKFGV